MNELRVPSNARRRRALLVSCTLACALLIGVIAWSDPGFDAGVARQQVEAQQARRAGPIDPLPLMVPVETVPLQMARDPFLALPSDP